MERSSHLWLGMGIGSIVGAFAYHYSRTPNGERMKKKISNTLHKIGNQAGDLLDTAKQKAMDAGMKGTDKIADKTQDMAYKADQFRDKVHAMATENK